jgi:hypothetical protein
MKLEDAENPSAVVYFADPRGRRSPMPTSTSNPDYYVYVYIDPRDFSEFYYGKGWGNRKNAHLDKEGDSEKSKIISEIRTEGLKPIIRVIAKGLTEDQALLVEKTLIWKLGRNLANVATGAYAENFRPQKTIHKEIFGFDFSNGIYFFNCGDNGHNFRKWEDFKNYGFITAGGHPKYSDPIKSFEIGDIVCTYLSKHGYVGICRILSKAVLADEFKINGKPIFDIKTEGHYQKKTKVPENREFMCRLEWIVAADREKAFFMKRSGLYTPQLVKASMQNQLTTLNLIEKHFGIQFKTLLNADAISLPMLTSLKTAKSREH